MTFEVIVGCLSAIVAVLVFIFQLGRWVNKIETSINGLIEKQKALEDKFNVTWRFVARRGWVEAKNKGLIEDAGDDLL